MKVPQFIYRFKKPKYYLPLASVVIIASMFLFGGGNEEGGIETEKAAKADVFGSVSETGVIEPAEKVELSLERSGRVVGVNVKEGDRVTRGKVLVSVDSSQAYADVLSARARLQAEEARLLELRNGGSSLERTAGARGVDVSKTSLENAEANLRETKQRQDELVRSAREELQSGDLRAYLTEGARESTDFTYTPPTITGTYRGAEEGEYVIRLYPSAALSGYSFTYTGIEKGNGSVSTAGPELFGTRGLFIQFPDNFARGRSLEWIVPVPNTRSSSYVSNKNAYDLALRTRESAISDAESALVAARAGLNQTEAEYLRNVSPARSEQLLAQEALVAQMRASLRSAEVSLAQGTLIAPFSGLITSVEADRGELLIPGTPVVSLISDADFEVSVNVPEADIANVEVGDKAQVMFDAYGDDIIFEARVVSIDPAAREIEGVPSFKTTLQFVEDDERIRAGLSADVEIIAAEARDVVAIPTRAVFERDGKEWVRIRNVNGEILEREVTTGLRGSEGTIEVTNGVTLGDEVVTFLSEKELEKLNKDK